jgi:hypothetical protein
MPQIPSDGDCGSCAPGENTKNDCRVLGKTPGVLLVKVRYRIPRTTFLWSCWRCIGGIVHQAQCKGDILDQFLEQFQFFIVKKPGLACIDP